MNGLCLFWEEKKGKACLPTKLKEEFIRQRNFILMKFVQVVTIFIILLYIIIIKYYYCGFFYYKY